ncbi:hypothetical protein GCM10011297_02460 [Bacterioplanes sanyensis]|uniref:BLUF domain-containing protein n=1 Tax=Bacterioplanes sanyensis TaxID=1249553 RepID=UPI0019CCD790|nr:BLUF domain-containing protein [Bacterioplanes sanyensis]GGY33023.1 hypothetical protein GCM10011297_02460 [Bacterioplanes sanyensis]
MLIELLYVSRSRQRFDDLALTELLRVARRNNQSTGITGLLLYDGRGTFIQALEGDDDQVMPLFNLITTDARHDHVHVLGRQRIQQRSFPEWQMGFFPLSPELIAKVEGYSDFMFADSQQQLSQAETSFAFRMLDYFRLKARLERERHAC